jgi:hypothetical protein
MRPSVAFDMVGGYGCGESGIKEVSRAGRQGAGRKTNGETFFSASTGFYVSLRAAWVGSLADQAKLLTPPKIEFPPAGTHVFPLHRDDDRVLYGIISWPFRTHLTMYTWY